MVKKSSWCCMPLKICPLKLAENLLSRKPKKVVREGVSPEAFCHKITWAWECQGKLLATVHCRHWRL